MPKKSKKKDKNQGKPKNRVTCNPGVGPAVSSSRHCDVQYRESPVKSDTDPNQYRVIELPNGLVALLISGPTDPSIEQEHPKVREMSQRIKLVCPQFAESIAAAKQQRGSTATCCLCVNVGFFCDPRQLPGLARVVGAAVLDLAFGNDREISNECKKMLKRGASRMMLKSEKTTFCVKVPPHLYREVIERLGHSLESAVLPKYLTNVAREDGVIFEEPQGDITTPERERRHLFSQFVPRKHPARAFDKHGLDGVFQLNNDRVYREVQKFRKRHYSAHRMTVVMKAELSLDTLETYAKEYFSRITNNGLPPELFDSYNFANSLDYTKFRRIWRIDSPCDKQMYVTWMMPPSSWLYRTKSLEFLSWLFSYGGAGSLMSYLKMKNWATEFHGGLLDEPAWNTSLYSTFYVSVTLTNDVNYENKLDILDAIYSYINFLKREGPQKSIYDESFPPNKNSQMYFHRYRQADLETFEDVEKLTEDMHLYPSVDYLAAPFYWYEHDPVSLSIGLNLMTPAKACIMVTKDSFGDNLEDKLADLVRDERSTEIPEDWIDRWQTIEPLPDFKLPERNIFCPRDLTIIDAPAVLQKYPIKVHSDVMSEVWYKFDPTRRVPKCRMHFCYASPLPLESPENAAMLDLFALILQTLSHDELYPATVAGSSYMVESCFLGLVLIVGGYTQQLPTFTRMISKSYGSLTGSLFETKKEELLDRYVVEFSSDLNLATSIRLSLLMPGRWSELEKHTALACVQFERFRHFAKHYVDHVYIKCLAQGNVAEADAVKNALGVVEVSRCGPFPRNIMPRGKVNKIPRGKHCCTVKSMRHHSTDVVVENYYQFHDSSMELGCVLRYVRGFLESLRSTRTLIDADHKNAFNDYIVGLVDSNTSTINAKRIASMDADIENQRKMARHYLKEYISSKAWKNTDDSTIALVRESANFMPNDFLGDWDEIVKGDYNFNLRSRQLDALLGMHKADFFKWLEYITDDANISKLSIRIVGDHYSRAEFSTVNPQPDEPQKEPNNTRLYRLQYLTENVGQSENPPYNCITDINEYRKQLEASSNTNRNS